MNEIGKGKYMSNRTNEEIFGEGVGFERIRRITGYLVGDYHNMNDAKQAEVKDRVKHEDNRNTDTKLHNN